jgi:hypothetical protein
MAQLSAIKAMFHNDAKVLERLDRIEALLYKDANLFERLDRIEAMQASTENVVTSVHNILKSLEKVLHGATEQIWAEKRIDSNQESLASCYEALKCDSFAGQSRDHGKVKLLRNKIKLQYNQSCHNSRFFYSPGQERDMSRGDTKQNNGIVSRLVDNASNSDSVEKVVKEVVVRDYNSKGFGDHTSNEGEQVSLEQASCLEPNQKSRCSPNKVSTNAGESEECMGGVSKSIAKSEPDVVCSSKAELQLLHSVHFMVRDPDPKVASEDSLMEQDAEPDVASGLLKCSSCPGEKAQECTDGVSK